MLHLRVCARHSLGSSNEAHANHGKSVLLPNVGATGAMTLGL